MFKLKQKKNEYPLPAKDTLIMFTQFMLNVKVINF